MTSEAKKIAELDKREMDANRNTISLSCERYKTGASKLKQNELGPNPIETCKIFYVILQS